MSVRMINGLTNTRQVLFGVLLIGVVGTLIGASTLALYQDTDTVSSNTVQPGTLNVTIDGADDGVGQTFSITNGQPADTATYNFTLRNGGSTAADHLQVNTTFAENDPTGTYDSEPGDTDLNAALSAAETAKYIEVTTLAYHDGGIKSNLLTSISDDNNNGHIDLADVQNHSAMDDLAAPPENEGGERYLEITVKVGDDSGTFDGPDEDLMGDGVDVSLHFSLMQDSSQDVI